ncbi:hypothetical protein PG991_009033 [Apiospora marii]|uniref:Uncharacterized protein n=1 Tax=Apiospora marii TaxID=335849 RepID=A0ABR1RJI7_9PEZI
MGQEKREEALEATAPLQEEVRGQDIKVARDATVWVKTVVDAVGFRENFAAVGANLANKQARSVILNVHGIYPEPPSLNPLHTVQSFADVAIVGKIDALGRNI